MPSEWEYTIGGFGTVNVQFDRRNQDPNFVTLELDLYGVRKWDPEEAEDHFRQSRLKRLEWDEEAERYEEFGKGASATFRYEVDDRGIASFYGMKGISSDDTDGDWIGVSWITLAPHVEGIVLGIPGVEGIESLFDDFENRWQIGEQAEIE